MSVSINDDDEKKFYNIVASSSDEPPVPAAKSSPIKEAVKLYGKTVLVVYVVGGLINLSLCYLAVDK